LRGASRPLYDMYDVALLDLDGVVYTGATAVDGVPEALAMVRSAGMRLAFVTNNASRTATAVAKHLTELGVPADAEEITTAAHAAATYLASTLRPGAPVLVVGGAGLVEAVIDSGLVPVTSADAGPVAVVQGYGADVDWWALAEAALAIRRGLPWVATNLDATLPSARGPLPGNGALVAALRHATGAAPSVVVGKPHPAMHLESLQRCAAQRPLVVGDRLDTDIAGARAAECDSLLVLSGITDAMRLITAPPDSRPTYVAHDVRGLLAVHPEPVRHRNGAACGGWRVARARRSLRLSRKPGIPRNPPASASSDLDALRALCAAAWGFSVGMPELMAGDETSRDVMDRLGLP
jgi:glycerol-1-phosphatase